jgi:5-dehydro-2-deoxygluconokinase
MKVRQERELLRLPTPRAVSERELLVEIVASKNGLVDDRTIARVIERLYEIGIQPDWWKLKARPTKAWDNIACAIEAGDPYALRRVAAWA